MRGALLGWRGRIEKLRNRCDKLSGREWLRQHDAVRDALGRPLVGFDPAHVNDGKVRIDFSSVPRDLPPVELFWTEINVRDNRAVFAFRGIKQRDGIFAGRSNYSLKSTFAQAAFDNALNELVVFNDQNK